MGELEDNPDSLPECEGPAPESSSENDGLLGEPNGNEESAVLPEQMEEKVAGIVEEEAPMRSDSQPPAGAAAPTDDEDDPGMKAAIAASLEDTREADDDLNNPFAAD